MWRMFLFKINFKECTEGFNWSKKKKLWSEWWSYNFTVFVCFGVILGCTILNCVSNAMAELLH